MASPSNISLNDRINDVKKLVSKFGLVPSKVWLKAIPKIKFHKYDKNTLFVTPGYIEDKLYMVLSGTVGMCILNKGKEHFVDFRVRGQFATTIISFIEQVPAEHGLKSLKPCLLASLPREVLYELMDSNLETSILARKFYEIEFAREVRRKNEMYIFNAEERYLRLLKYKPEITNEIPLKYLASYLGIEAESLSRIRARLAK